MEKWITQAVESLSMAYSDKKFSGVLVGDVFEQVVLKPSTVGPDAKIRDVIEKMEANPLSRKAYVVDGENKYLGTVSSETVLKLLGYRVGVKDGSGLSFYHFLRDALKEDVASVMKKGRVVTKEMPLTKAMEIMMEDHLNDLPVVDDEGRLIGELVSLEIFIKGKELFQ